MYRQKIVLQQTDPLPFLQKQRERELTDRWIDRIAISLDYETE